MGTTPRFATSLLLASPAILLTFSGLVLLAMAPFTWSVAAHVGMPDWLITVCVLVVAVPVIVIGFGSTRLILTYTRRPFHVFILHLPFVVALPAAAGIVLFFASRVTEPSTYDNLRQTTSRPRQKPCSAAS